MSFEEKTSSDQEKIPSKEILPKSDDFSQRTEVHDVTLAQDEINEEEETLRKIKDLEERAAIFDFSSTERAMQEKIDEEKKIEKVRLEAEEVRKETISHIGEHEYLKKLIIEFGGDAEKALAEQNLRKANVQKVRIMVKSLDDVATEYKVRAGREANKGTVGFYSPDKGDLFISYDYYDARETASHELLHAATIGKTNISKNAAEMLGNAYSEQKTFFNLFSEDLTSYFSDPAEMLVRKQALDKDLEKNGIKKYGEKFTADHYTMMMSLYKRGELSSDSMQFIKRIKKEKLKDIFDKIAENKEYGEEKLIA